MDIATCEDMLYDTPYTMCGFCRCQVKKREDARWVDIGHEEYAQISCTECASKHPDDKVSLVERPKDVERILEIDEEIYEMNHRIHEISNERTRLIKKLLEEEGYHKGMEIYFRHKKYAATGLIIGTLNNKTRVRVELSPFNKDGSIGKYNKSELDWVDFIRLYRMQRADVDAYLEHCKEREEEIKKRRTMKITDDMV